LDKVSKDKFYDFGRGKSPGYGGTTTLVYNHQSQTVEKEYLSLAGTVRNCAGGPTPWGSWLTCEETTVRADDVLERDHGYVFEVPASENPSPTVPVPLKGMGRFNHEAVAVDPKTGIVYLTEDDSEGLIYRFIPKIKGRLAGGGKLQMLGLAEIPSADTRNWTENVITQGKAYPVRWIDIDDVDSPDNDLRFRGFSKGAARFARGEGMWYGKNSIFFACTNGGKIKSGQVFRYTPGQYEGTAREKESPGKLALFVEPNDKEIFKNCDNLTVAPSGDIVLCEDHDHPFIVGITPKGEYYKIAENTGYESEFAGGVFSPDGKTFFVNIQHVGLTVAIEGPWR
jgi:secreted PhoX family phosphatase